MTIENLLDQVKAEFSNHPNAYRLKNIKYVAGDEFCTDGMKIVYQQWIKQPKFWFSKDSQKYIFTNKVSAYTLIYKTPISENAIRAVAAHEFAHIVNGDVEKLEILDLSQKTISITPLLIRPNRNTAGFFLGSIIVGYFATGLISRRFESRADRTAVEINENYREGLIEFFEAKYDIDVNKDAPVFGLIKILSTFLSEKINPSHPSTKSRIEDLKINKFNFFLRDPFYL